MRIEIPVSIGELADRICILRIKKARLTEPEKLANVTRELGLLEDLFDGRVGHRPPVEPSLRRLHEVNLSIWEVEDDLREHESRGDFGESFVTAARSVYRLNDERFLLKRAIDEVYGSEIREEKSYPGSAASGS